MHRYYMFDRGIMQPQGMSNLRILPCKAQKDFDHNPLFREDFFSDPPRKWEVRYDNSYPNVIYDPDESIYRLYYTLIVRDEVSESTSLAQRAGQNYVPLAGRVVAMAYAQSKDGVHWEKPSLGLVEFDGSTDNNIMMMYAHGTGVFRDAQEIDPARRYKLVTKLDYPGTTGHMAVSFSADGIHWSPLIAWPRYNPQADSHNFAFRDPADGKFKLITRVWKNGLRISAVCESTDFINWSEPKEILRGNGFGSQVYSMPVYCTAGIYIGFASMFHEGDRETEDFDCVDCELTYATHLDAFDYAAPGIPFIDRGEGRYPTGAFDCGCIYAAAPVEIGDKLCIYYMGGNGQHTNFRETSFARAFLEKDRWAYIEPKDAGREGVFATMPFHFYGERFELLTDISEGGSVSVELRDRWNGKAFDGFSASDAILTEENGALSVRFAKPFSSLGTANPCVVLRVNRARVYALRGDLEIQSRRY